LPDSSVVFDASADQFANGFLGDAAHIGRTDGFHPADALAAVNNQITNLKHRLILLFYKKGVLFEQLDLRSSNNTL
jgi:hypothetical protein